MIKRFSLTTTPQGKQLFENESSGKFMYYTDYAAKVAELEASLAAYKHDAEALLVINKAAIAALEAAEAKLEQAQLDAERLVFVAECEHVSVNKWLVQVIHAGKWSTCSFADPPGGPAPNKAVDKITALRETIDAAIAAGKET